MFKPGDKVICITNSGMSRSITVGKTYIVDSCYVQYGALQIDLIGDEQPMVGVFASRFISIQKYKKIERKNKLENICLKSEIE